MAQRGTLLAISQCTTIDAFVMSFRRYAEPTALFVPTANPLPTGDTARIVVTLRDGSVVLEGDIEVRSAVDRPAGLHGRPGMTLRFTAAGQHKELLAHLVRAKTLLRPAAIADHLKPKPKPEALRLAAVEAAPPVAPITITDPDLVAAECVLVDESGSILPRFMVGEFTSTKATPVVPAGNRPPLSFPGNATLSLPPSGRRGGVTPAPATRVGPPPQSRDGLGSGTPIAAPDAPTLPARVAGIQGGTSMIAIPPVPDSGRPDMPRLQAVRTGPGAWTPDFTYTEVSPVERQMLDDDDLAPPPVARFETAAPTVAESTAVPAVTAPTPPSERRALPPPSGSGLAVPGSVVGGQVMETIAPEPTQRPDGALRPPAPPTPSHALAPAGSSLSPSAAPTPAMQPAPAVPMTPAVPRVDAYHDAAAGHHSDGAATESGRSVGLRNPTPLGFEATMPSMSVVEPAPTDARAPSFAAPPSSPAMAPASAPSMAPLQGSMSASAPPGRNVALASPTPRRNLPRASVPVGGTSLAPTRSFGTWTIIAVLVTAAAAAAGYWYSQQRDAAPTPRAPATTPSKPPAAATTGPATGTDIQPAPTTPTSADPASGGGNQPPAIPSTDPANATPTTANPTTTTPTEPVPPPATAKTPTAAEPRCKVALTAEPSDAKVMVGDQAVGTAKKLKTLPCSTTELTLTHPKYAPMTLTTKLKSDETTKLKAKLERPLFKVHIASKPTGASITVDDKVVGKTPATIQLRGFRGNKAELRKKGYKTKRVEITPTATDSHYEYELVKN